VAAIARDLDLRPGSAEATLYLAAGGSLDGPRGARTLLRQARTQRYAEHRELSRAAWAAWLARARLPDTDDAQLLTLARRSLAVLRAACDRPSGSMVASVAPQLPYALDWTRDGAFLNLALDEAGYPELVTRHNAYYARIQRADGLLAGTYPMNTYEDGTPGGPIFLEIDNAALATWTLADHTRFLPEPERQAYRERVWPAVRRGAQFLVRWRDPWSHLPLPANEDDDPGFSRGIQATVTAILALRAAETLARDLSAGDADGWKRRRAELTEALFRHLWDDDAGRLVDGGPKELDASAWAIWPCAVFEPGDPRADAQGEYLWRELQRALSGEKARSGYDAKLFLALAALWGPHHPRRPQLVEAYRRFAHELPTPDTGLLGEHYRIHRQPGGGVRFEHLNDVPHVWEHALHYLTLLRLFPPRSD
jgi:GH15 family glucan-1,4-alpha-glucosidase